MLTRDKSGNNGEPFEGAAVLAEVEITRISKGLVSIVSAKVIQLSDDGCDLLMDEELQIGERLNLQILRMEQTLFADVMSVEPVYSSLINFETQAMVTEMNATSDPEGIKEARLQFLGNYRISEAK